MQKTVTEEEAKVLSKGTPLMNKEAVRVESNIISVRSMDMLKQIVGIKGNK